MSEAEIFDPAPGVCVTSGPETHGYRLNHTMLRIKDPKRSLDFYTRILGMRLLRRFDFPEMRFTLYFLTTLDEPEATPENIPANRAERATWVFSARGMLELTHNWGTEDDPECAYHDGNSEPKGFGHLGLTVPDVYAACERLHRLEVPFVKEVDDGRMRGLAFVRDPDGYWIEILQADMVEQRGASWGLAT